MEILSILERDHVPRRIVHGPGAHAVGGKATPWQLKKERRPIEVAIWTAGCNLRCPQCQNFVTTYDGSSAPMTPDEAAEIVTRARRRYDVDRMAISGGEATLNRSWLVRYFDRLRRSNEDSAARLHLDSNGTLLTPDYIDELVLESGVTDIGIEPKAVRLETYRRITGLDDEEHARKLRDQAWQAVEHVSSKHTGRVFLGVGMPYNGELTSLDEVEEFGRRLADIDPEAQLCVLDYFPTFSRRDIHRPHPAEMLEVKMILESAGLRTVVVQTSVGHFGP